MTPAQPRWGFDNSFHRALPGLYADARPDVPSAPALVRFNSDLAGELGLACEDQDDADLAAWLSGAILPAGASPLAQAYAGHQFGHFSPQLGDGRAHLLGEIVTPAGDRFDLHLKGSGRTPFSRGGDGKAALGPVLREYLISEAMAALGIPTTRALAAIATGDGVWRETPLPGAVLARIAASHIRVGTVQWAAAHGGADVVSSLVDYTLARHYPDAAHTGNPALALLHAVMEAQADLVAQWMGVGFIHGVMNTDNMTLSGETIDYGPCAFMDVYAPDTVFSSIDTQGRYAYANQPGIARWNLTRLAEGLLTAIDPDMDRAVAMANDAMAAFPALYEQAYLSVMGSKLGLTDRQDGDIALIQDLFPLLEGQRVDFTLFFRALGEEAGGSSEALAALLSEPDRFAPWQTRWSQRLSSDPRAPHKKKAAMDAVNPLYIARNHKVEDALSAASDAGDIAPFEQLLALLRAPYTRVDGADDYAHPAPDSFGPYKTFCGT